MRRRAFVQLTGLYAAVSVLPSLAGCGAIEEPTPTRPEPGASGEPSVASTIATGSQTRAVAADGSSASLSADEHVVDVFDPTGVRVARVGGAALSGTRNVGAFNGPVAATWDGPRLLVLEKGNARIQAIASSGAVVGVVAETALAPTDLVIDPEDRALYVVSPLRHRIDVLDANGRALRSIGRFGSDGGGLNGPLGAAISADRTVHVVDAGSASIKVFALDGRFVGAYGVTGGDDARLVAPRAIRFDAGGRAWVADTLANVVRVYDAGGRFVTKVTPRLPDGRPATPISLAALPDGSVYASVVLAAAV
jgi:DNA-binding beta-propeller fold protein YncE